MFLQKKYIKFVFFCLCLLLYNLSFGTWEEEKKNAGRYTVELQRGFFFEDTVEGSLSFFYQSDEQIELGWAIHFFNFKEHEQYIEGNYLSFGPIWRYTSFSKKSGFGLSFNLRILITLQSKLTTTESILDISKFNFELLPEISFYKKIKLSRNTTMYPTIGIKNCLSFFNKTGVEESYKRGVFEADVKLSLPLKIVFSSGKALVIQPSYSIDLYASKFNKMIPVSIMIGYIY